MYFSSHVLKVVEPFEEMVQFPGSNMLNKSCEACSRYLIRIRGTAWSLVLHDLHLCLSE